jgi:hypothetical protein
VRHRAEGDRKWMIRLLTNDEIKVDLTGFAEVEDPELPF